MTGENSIALADWSRFIADCRTPGVEALDPWERSARSRRLAAEQRELDRERARERRRRYRLRHPDRVRESDLIGDIGSRVAISVPSTCGRGRNGIRRRTVNPRGDTGDD